MIKHALLASAAILLPAISYADVELTNWGTSASSVVFSDCPSYCTGGTNTVEDGGINLTRATITYSDIYGSADILAEINGSAYTPVLKARSVSAGGAGANANALVYSNTHILVQSQLPLTYMLIYMVLFQVKVR